MEEVESELRKRKSRGIETDPWVGKSLTSREKHGSNSLPNVVGYGIIIAFSVVILFFHYFENFLPEQIKLKDASLHPGRFIGERAELQLKRLTSLGPRVVGSYENEVLAVDFLKREISFITQDAEKIHKIEVDVQKPTGSYYLQFKPHGFRNYYANIQNVVVKLSSGNATDSVLLNCHYDTVPESPGASDNGVNCVVMLEILHVLANEKVPLKRNVIFLFNGAEENPLQASHGFLSHKWSKEVKVLINLDSAGAGGKEMLFQTSGEPWLAKAYAKAVPRPTAGVQGEEIFQFGIIPSDTDFRVFRDFAGYPGFDIAHCTNGYVYHTKFDTMDFVRPGVYQNTGDNLLALVRELVNSSELSRVHSKTRMVYFDVFTLFTVVYTERFGIIVNSMTILLSLAAIFKVMRKLPVSGIRAAERTRKHATNITELTAKVTKMHEELTDRERIASYFPFSCAISLNPKKLCGRKNCPSPESRLFHIPSLSDVLSNKNRHVSINLLKAAGGQVLGLFLGAAVVFFIAKTLDSYKSVMSWYLRPWLFIPLYVFPIVLATTTGLLLVQRYMQKQLVEHKVIRYVNGAQLVWTVILLIGTLKGIRTAYMLTLVLLFPSLGSLIFSYSGNAISAKKYLITYACCLTFPTLFILNQIVRIFTVLIPMTARMGPEKNPEEIMGALVFLSSSVFLSQIVPNLLLLRKLKRFLISLCIIHALAVIGVVCTKYGFPYDGNVRNPALQRFYLLHCEKTFHDAKGAVRRSDSGIFIQSLDRNNVNYLTHLLPELQTAKLASEDCPTEMFCGFPIFTSRFIGPAPYSYFVPAAAPTLHHSTTLEVVNQTQILVNTRRIHLLVTGPDHVTVGLSPRRGIELVKWSFEDGAPISLGKWNERQVYMVYYSHGLMGGTLDFYVDLQIGKDPVDHFLDVAVVGHYMHDKKFRTSEFKRLASKFPDWAHLTSWTTSYKSWII